MTSTSEIETALAVLMETGLPFVLMIEQEGALSLYSNNKDDRLILVNKEE